MKIIAAIMDVVFVKPWFREFKITTIKKFLVYDPSKVSGWDIERRIYNEGILRLHRTIQ